MRKVVTLATIAVLMSFARVALAAEVEVKMLNRGTEGAMVFEPALVKIEPGDTVKFIAADKGHNAESIKGMLPADATPFVGKSGEDAAVTFDKPGAYGVKCLPRNLAEAKAVPQVGKAKQVFAALFEKLPTQAAAAK
jgi:pseudoazurin